MVKLGKIYTRGGDKGDTSLADGSRVSKSETRVAVIGAVDETNAAIGLARLHTEGVADAMLERIQNDLFDLGADLAHPHTGKKNVLRISPAQTERLEGEIDQLGAALQPLTSFVLPGGSRAAAYLHFARTIARRAERLMVSLAATETVNAAAATYINRLSDLLFQLARHQNADGRDDRLWVPGENR